MPFIQVVVAASNNGRSKLDIGRAAPLPFTEVVCAKRVCLCASAIPKETSRGGRICPGCNSRPGPDRGGIWVINYYVVRDSAKSTACAHLDIAPLVGPVEIGAPKTDAFVTADGLGHGIGDQVIHEFHHMFVGVGRRGSFAGRTSERPIYIIDRRDGFD